MIMPPPMMKMGHLSGALISNKIFVKCVEFLVKCVIVGDCAYLLFCTSGKHKKFETEGPESGGIQNKFDSFLPPRNGQ